LGSPLKESVQFGSAGDAFGWKEGNVRGGRKSDFLVSVGGGVRMQRVQLVIEKMLGRGRKWEKETFLGK